MDGSIVRCANCGQANRMPRDAADRKVVCGRCKTPLTTASQDGVIIATDSTFATLVGGSKPFVVDFWAAWCGPCRQIAPKKGRIVGAVGKPRIEQAIRQYFSL